MVHHKLFFCRLTILFFLAICIWGFTTCSSADPKGPTDAPTTDEFRPVPFAQLAHGESYTADLQTPVLLIGDNADQITRLAGLVNNPDVNRQLQSFDFSSTIVIAIFSGPMGSSGYSVTIEDILTNSRASKLIVKLSAPQPGQNVATVITYPYNIVLVPHRALNMSARMEWTVVTVDGKLMVRTRYP